MSHNDDQLTVTDIIIVTLAFFYASIRFTYAPREITEWLFIVSETFLIFSIPMAAQAVGEWMSAYSEERKCSTEQRRKDLDYIAQRAMERYTILFWSSLVVGLQYILARIFL